MSRDLKGLLVVSLEQAVAEVSGITGGDDAGK